MNRQKIDLAPGGQHTEVKNNLDYLAVHGPTVVYAHVKAVRVFRGLECTLKSGARVDVLHVKAGAKVYVEQGATIGKVIIDSGKDSMIMPLWDFSGGANAALGLKANVNLHGANTPAAAFVLASYFPQEK